MQNINLENAISKKLLNAVSKEIDISKLAKKIAPQVERAITNRIMQSAAKIEIDDFVHDCMGREFYKTMERVLISALKTKLR